MYTYFPSCNLTIASPASSKKMRQYLSERMNVAGCCRYDKKEYPEDEIGLTVCQACREVLSPKIHTETLWKYIDQDPSFVFPDYSGLRVNVQDCYRDKEYPEVAQQIRSLLSKMHIQVTELENPDDFCGTLYYQPKSQELLSKINQHSDTKLSHLPEELQAEIMHEHVLSFTEDIVVCDCNRCVKGIQLGGGNPVHLMDLLMNEYK